MTPVTVAELISHLRECDQGAKVEVQLDDAHVAAGPGWSWARGAVLNLTSGNRDGREFVILNAREES